MKLSLALGTVEAVEGDYGYFSTFAVTQSRLAIPAALGADEGPEHH